jgi:hypothetical protein
MLFFSFLAIAAVHAVAQPRPPAEFHGYELGTTYTITANLYEYYRELARESPRVEYHEYGRSIQGRPLASLVIGSEDNLARLDEIQERLRGLTQVVEPLSDARLSELVSGTPAVVSIFIVDTDEEAGVEVLQEIAYELATREDELARRVRENVVVVMAPLTNPDSHARYVTWHKLYDVDGAAVDPYAVENRAHWGMNTDGNAHGIDVNRDFGFFVSPEMQAFARYTVEFRPQILLDIHSGPNVIFLPPFPPPYHPLWPDEAKKWWDAVAVRASDAFGKRGWSFNSREGYEGVTSVGFGLSWGMLGPSVSSFLFETFGGRPQKTTAFVRSDGTIATMRMAMDRHALGTWSLLETVASRREELLRDAHRVVVEAVQQARTGPVRAVVLPSRGEGVDPEKVHRLVTRLALQGIRVQQIEETFRAPVRDFYELTRETDRSFPEGSYLIDIVQPMARLARALLDPMVEQGEPQVLVPFSRRMPYYDTTWSVLPLLFGVEAFAASNPVAVSGDIVEMEPRSAGGVERLSRTEPPYAYVLPAGRESSYRTAIRLMRDGYRLRVFTAPFRLGDRTFAKGTWAAIRQRNPEGLGERIEALVEEHGSTAIEVAGPYTDAGVVFGDDRRLAPVPTPRVAVVADQPVAQDHTFGGIRTVLESDFGFSFTPVMLETINRSDLSKYSAVVLPHAGMDIRGGPGFSRGYRGLLDTSNLGQYVRNGGTLIAVQGAADVIASDELLGAGVEFEGWAEHTNGATLRARWDVAASIDDDTASWRPGLAEIGLPLLAAGYTRDEFGAPGAYPVLLGLSEESRARAVASYVPDEDRLQMDGFMLESDRELLAGRPFIVIAPVGRGRVIYFACDPTFRGYWYGLNLAFLNALMLGSLF